MYPNDWKGKVGQDEFIGLAIIKRINKSNS